MPLDYIYVRVHLGENALLFSQPVCVVLIFTKKNSRFRKDNKNTNEIRGKGQCTFLIRSAQFK